MNIICAPFSNSTIRDWPASHFVSLIGLLLERWQGDGLIRVIGTRGQWMRACEIVRPFSSSRVTNDCGVMPWNEVVSELRNAACVIGNNSGIAHLSGMLGAPTVCVFGGSHQRQEWRPLGANVALVSRTIGCSPCHLDHGRACLYDKACLREIHAEAVADAAFRVMAARTQVDSTLRAPVLSG